MLAVAVGLEESPVDKLKPVLVIRDGNQLLGALHGIGQDPHLVFRLFAPGDVFNHGDDVSQPACGIANG